jgi:nucleotide-binding universal stress UspA family protein
MPGEIVVGYDGGEGADRALAAATPIAKDLGAKLVLTFAYEPVHAVGIYGELSDHRRALKEFGEQRTAKGLEQAKGAGVEAEAVLVAKRPADALVETASERGARMLVVGSNGEKPLVGAIIGSVPYKLVSLSEVPVLIVRT